MPEREENTEITRSSAHEAASNGLEVVRGFDSELSADAQLHGTHPLEIWDPSGDILFYDFEIRTGDRVVGHVRTAADERVAASIVAIERRPRWWNTSRDPIAFGVTKAEEHPAVKAVLDDAPRIVCYSYPKLAVQVGVVDHEDRDGSRLFDVASGAEVPIRGLTGQFTLAPHLATVSDDEVASASYRVDVERLTASARVLGSPRLSLPRFILFGGQVWLSPECESVLGVPLLGQITDYNCVPASAQMALDHYGWNYSQDQIAAAMGTSAANGGTYYSGFASGIASLTSNTMYSAQPDVAATRPVQWALMVGEIDANRPVLTQMPHHYRACVGYEQVLSMQFLHIHDPWPWNPNICQGGADYWENWAGTSVEWFVQILR